MQPTAPQSANPVLLELLGRECAIVTGMERIEAGQAHCAVCGEVIRPGEEAFVTPDFLADEADPFWRFADAPMHRACFLVWDRRKAFVARYNRAARLLVAPDGSRPRMTSEGEIVRQWGGSPPPRGPAA
ncbi:MAG: hypothetical protein ACREMZ_05640 [Gemmatimonadales bacterium]